MIATQASAPSSNVEKKHGIEHVLVSQSSFMQGY